MRCSYCGEKSDKLTFGCCDECMAEMEDAADAFAGQFDDDDNDNQ